MSEQDLKQQVMVNITIDGKPITVPKGTTVYNAAKAHGIEIPIFCYLDRLPPFGACRMCLVEVEKMGKLQASCTLEATEGMVVKTTSQEAEAGRKGILELLLINHPLDCPICDRGGECPLQDRTMEYGPGKSRFVEEKRRFKKALPLGPLLMLDRERCIVCARCTRFGEHIAADHALEFKNRGFKTEVGTPDGGPADSKFIGNTIMICPVGALTSQVYRFRARPWDNDSTETTCTLCPVGCSMILDARDGEVMRTRSRENKAVNDIWLCDKGWFGYEFTTHKDRLQTPLIRKEGKLLPASWDEAIALVAKKIAENAPQKKVGAFGGNPLTLEENYLFQQIFRQGALSNHIDHRVGMPLFSAEEELFSAHMAMPIGECEQITSFLLLGLDITEEFPVIWLRVKQALNKGAKMAFFGHYAPEIFSQLSKCVVHEPGKECEILKEQFSNWKQSLKNGEKAAIFVGSQYLHANNRREILLLIQDLCQDNHEIVINIMEGRGNSMGARLAGMRPDFGPGNSLLENKGLNCSELIIEGAEKGWDLLYVAGANPAVKYPKDLWQKFREKLGFLVVQDLFLTETAKNADVIFPVLSFTEKRGTFINISQQKQKILPGKDVPENIYSDGEIFSLLAAKLGVTPQAMPADLLSNNSFSSALNAKNNTETSKKEPLEKGLLKASFSYQLFDEGTRMRHNLHLIKMAKEPFARLHSSAVKQLNLSCGQTALISSSKGNELPVKIKIDDNVAENTIVLPRGFPQLPIEELGENLLNGMVVKIRPAAA